MKTLILLAVAFALFLSASEGARRGKRTDVGVIGGADGPTAVYITKNGGAAGAESAEGSPVGDAGYRIDGEETAASSDTAEHTAQEK